MGFGLMKDMLLQDNYFVINKAIMKAFGFEAALVLSSMAEAEKMLADKEGWFYQTADTLENQIGLSRYRQDVAIEKLIEIGVLKKKVKGMPAKRYFKFNDKALNSKIAKNLNTSIEKINKQDCKKFATSKESTIKKVNKESNKDIAVLENGDALPYEEVVSYLNKQAGRRYRHTTAKTQRLIRARFNEGFKLDDFKQVIDTKVSEWKQDTEMSKYLRPETLFGTKFESYLNQPTAANKKRSWDEWDFL